MKTKAINVQVPAAVHERLRKAAQAERRSLRQQIALFLEEAAARFEAEEDGRGAKTQPKALTKTEKQA